MPQRAKFGNISLRDYQILVHRPTQSTLQVSCTNNINQDANHIANAHIKMKNIILFLSIIFFISRNTNACSCKYLSKTENIEERIVESKMIFKGRVIKNKTNRNHAINKYGFTTTIFEIEEIYKGKSAKRKIKVLQTNSNCQYQFLINTTYIIYTSKIWGLQTTNQCTPTRRYSQDLAELSLLQLMHN